MSLRKVTFFDKRGPTLISIDEDGQPKPAIFGRIWVNADTFETIRTRGGRRTDRFGHPIEDIPPTGSMNSFYAGGFSDLDEPPDRKKR
jgi:hypothetical protein